MLGEIKEKAFSFLPKFTMYIDGEEVGTIQKELILFYGLNFI